MERAAAEAEAEAHVAGVVHGDAAHPAIVGVRRVGSLLIDGEAAAGNAQLVPTHPDRAARGDAVIDDQGLVVAEVAVGEAVHEPVGEGIELLAGAGLGNAGAAAACLRKSGCAEGGRTGQGCIGRCGPVGVKLPVRELAGGCAEGDDVVGRSGRRLLRTVDVRRQQASVAGAEVEALLGGGRPGQHLGPVVGAHPATAEGRPTGEHVESGVVRVGPDRQLRVVGEVGVLE